MGAGVTDRELIHLARTALATELFDVWFAKHYRDLGRRGGSASLGISEDAWRYRLRRADRTLATIIERRDAA